MSKFTYIELVATHIAGRGLGLIEVALSKPSDSEGFVLAYESHKDEFITWAFSVREGKVDTFWGHYFSTFESAAEDFRKRLDRERSF